MAIQGLWAVPWLINFNGYSREVAASHLLFMSLGMLGGFICIAVFIGPLAALGVTPEKLLRTGLGIGLIVGGLILFDAAPTYALWSFAGIIFSIGNLSYAIITTNFAPQLTGRANTALNLSAFVGAFLVQWGFGVLVDYFSSQGATLHDAYRDSFAALLALQVISYLWYLLGSYGSDRR